MKIIFMGTPDFGVPSLKALVKAGHEIVGVYTRPPKPAGHGMHQQLSAVHQAALDLNLPVFTPSNFKDPKDIQQFKDLHADLAIVAAYGLILPQEILDGTARGCWNIHASKLPRWRGAAPIQRAIQAGDKTSALTIQKMNAGLDTGDILSQSEDVQITPDMTGGELHDIFSQKLAPQLLLDTIQKNPTPVPQPEGALYAPKIVKDELMLDFSLSPEVLVRFIQAMSPFPGTFCYIPDPFHPGYNIRLKIYGAELVPNKKTSAEQQGQVLTDDFIVGVSQGAIRITSLQQSGRRKQTAKEFLNGMPVAIGQKLTGRTEPSLHFFLNQDSPITHRVNSELNTPSPEEYHRARRGRPQLDKKKRMPVTTSPRSSKRQNRLLVGILSVASLFRLKNPLKTRSSSFKQKDR